MLTLSRVLPADPEAVVVTVLALTAHDRTRSRHCFVAEDGTRVSLNLPRGTVLRGNCLLASDQGERVRVVAKPEPVVVVTAASALDLTRAAYHLGNRHVPLEISADGLKLEPDPVLEAMLAQLGGLCLRTATLPFEPEAGAYRQGEAHRHSPSAHAHHHDL
ncbi:MAG TPA: urease accessory protein UreE [Leptolyngbyaceae cyanobacterium M65_K2018_010]|nr:urease accessory protein UreE [Leptolyngbyaceae cyanobacterium M65_K2018_010]